MAAAAAERAQRWNRFLKDMRLYAGLPQPLEMQGTLVRVTGLVLEAAGVRAPVGAVCSVGAAAASRRSTPRWSASTATAPT
jgi:flagellum-specific ATP synthase